MQRLVLSLVTIFFCNLGFSSVVTAAPSCKKVYDQAMQRLYMIELNLHQVESKTDYRQSVKARFSEVEGLLLSSETCEKNTGISKNFLSDWHQMYMTLTALQASAQMSAFSDFRDWFKSKEQDIEVFEYAHGKRW